MKITLPDRLHRHQHGPLNNTIPQRGIPSGRSLPLFSGYKPVWLAGAGNDPGEDFLWVFATQQAVRPVALLCSHHPRREYVLLLMKG